MSSEYEFRIFISSPHYTLVDLRSELESWLLGMGYKPILSSAEGFPDDGQRLYPWEKCLRVLETCPLVIVIADGMYGDSKPWPNFSAVIQSEVSPTHGEYLFAQHLGKRTLVFVRDELMADYRRYCQARKVHGNDEQALQNSLYLPDHHDIRTLRLIEEIERAQPTPWMKAFHSVTDIKGEIHKQLLNAFVTSFNLAFRERVERLDTVIADLPEEKQRQILEALDIPPRLPQVQKAAQPAPNAPAPPQQANAVSDGLRQFNEHRLDVASGAFITSILGPQGPQPSLAAFKTCASCGKVNVLTPLIECPSCKKQYCEGCWNGNSIGPLAVCARCSPIKW